MTKVTATSQENGTTTTSKRRLADPEYAAMSELLNTFGEVEELRGNGNALSQPPKRLRATRSQARDEESGSDTTSELSPDESDVRRCSTRGATREKKQVDDYDDDENDDEADTDDDDDGGDNQSDNSEKSYDRSGASNRHPKLTDLEQEVRNLERENLHLKQTLLLGKKGSVMAASHVSHENVQRMLSERTRVVQEMVDLLNSPVLSLSDAARVWHEDCRVGVGVRDWDAFGRLETISLWSVVRSVFATIAVDIVELRPHLPDGEMILTKWRIQGEIASAQQLQSVSSSEDCPEMMRVVLKAIKSSDLTFTVTTYVIFEDSQIAEQHHCWDQVGVFKRLFGGEIPSAVQKMLKVVDPEDD